MARRSRGNAALAIVIGVLAMAAAAAMAQEEEEEEVMSLYQPKDPCQQVEGIVKGIVDEEFRKNKQITAGLLRVFFHDCFSRGCDASILLDAEWNVIPLQARVRQLVNEIRGEVNRQCGDNAVSCADILALATRDSVVAANGPKVNIFRGRFDSVMPGNIDNLPRHHDSIESLLGNFGKFGLDHTDLVALSGGHTVGKTKRCDFVRPAFQNTCQRNGNQQNLDETPILFDNKYFVDLMKSNQGGVFNSDQNLLSRTNTRELVQKYAGNNVAFFEQWKTSFKKLSNISWLTPSTGGQIRGDCTKPRLSNIIDADEGFAATA